MIELFDKLGSGWFGFISFLGLFGLALYNFLSPKFKVRHKEYDEVGNELIALLEKTKNELVSENDKLRREFNILKERLDVVSKEHEMLRDILQGRDKDTIKFRDQGFEAFENIKNLNDLTVKTHAKVLEAIQGNKKILEIVVK